VIGALEDAEDYKAFEAAIIADYDVQSAVERELVLRLASLLWRLRRATTMETGLFDIQADYLREFRQARQAQPQAQEIIYARFGRPEFCRCRPRSIIARHRKRNGSQARLWAETRWSRQRVSHFAFCVWPICPATRSTGLAGMKQSFGARPARSCLLSMHWIVANHKIEGAVSVSAVGKTCRPTDATTIELPDSCLRDRRRVRLGGQAIGTNHS
jgi:hypothetical protein